ncbi:MAG TPA: DUF3558 domain-containing protein [Actinophytocola sp.]|jgi:hypothetical protein|nr:DUF3558 domain-containing protein [Actinophytocola sp.]
MSSPRHALLAALLGLALTGCTTTSSGDPAPADSRSTSEPTEPAPSTDPAKELPYAGAPAVDNPLDTAEFQQDPCQTFTAAQAAELKLGTSGKPVDAPLGNACEWSNDQSRGYAQIRFKDKNPVGLSGEYQADQDDKFAYFDELDPIEGFPAVADDLTDRRQRGLCTVVVGVADDVTFATVVQLSQANIGQKDPCETAVDVAGMALQTMKAGA